MARPFSPGLAFYRDLPFLQSFDEIGDAACYHQIPDDWCVVITDVIGSTKAIQEGKYKQVNVAGGIATMAISNLLDDLDYPFVFGGDGVTILIPGDIVAAVTDILVDTRALVRKTFDLDLRVGIMPVTDIHAAGHELAVAKLRISSHYNQAMIAGGGLDWAESQLKSRDPDNPYLVSEDHVSTRKADFSGFTCRWQDVKSPLDETVALIVRIRALDPAEQQRLLHEVLDAIERHLGTEEQYHPLSERNVVPVEDERYLHNEVAVLSRSGPGSASYELRMLKTRFETAVLRYAVKKKARLPVKINGENIADLPRINVLSSDFRKYDNTLKMIVSCKTAARRALVDELDRMHWRGEIFFGVHVSDRALTTCLMHEGSVREVHFVDAADGGYAFASRQLKQQLKDAS